MTVTFETKTEILPDCPCSEENNDKENNNNGDDATPVASNLREKVAKSAAIHKATKVAASAKKSEQTTTPSAFAKAAKAIMEMEVMAIVARLSLLEDLATMNDTEKMECLFSLLDTNHDGHLSIIELANGLRKIRHPGATTTVRALEESLVVAMDKVAHFDRDGDAKLDREEFADCVNQLVAALAGASFHDVAELLILSVVFADDPSGAIGNGNDNDNDNNDEPDSPYPEGTEQLCEETIKRALKEEEALLQVMEDDRMRALFHLFDLDADGSVDFAEVVVGLYKMTEDLVSSGGTASAAMLLFDDEKNQLLDYSEFTRFVLLLIDSTGETFDDAIFTLTKSAASESDGPEHVTKDTVLEKLRAALAENEIVGPDDISDDIAAGAEPHHTARDDREGRTL